MYIPTVITLALRQPEEGLFATLYCTYLRLTFTFILWLTGLPIPLSALQWYVPEEVLLIFGKSKERPRFCSSTLVPSPNILLQVMFGVGLPDASQNNVTCEPSSTVWSSLTLVSLAGTKCIKKFSCTFIAKWLEHAYSRGYMFLTGYQISQWVSVLISIHMLNMLYIFIMLLGLIVQYYICIRVHVSITIFSLVFNTAGKRTFQTGKEVSFSSVP